MKVQHMTLAWLQEMHSTYDVEVGWVGSTWVSLDPWRASSLHVNDGGAQAIDVCLGVMTSTQDHLWTHVHLNERREEYCELTGPLTGKS